MGPYASPIKKAEKDIKDMAKKVNDLCGTFSRVVEDICALHFSTQLVLPRISLFCLDDENSKPESSNSKCGSGLESGTDSEICFGRCIASQDFGISRSSQVLRSLTLDWPLLANGILFPINR